MAIGSTSDSHWMDIGQNGFCTQFFQWIELTFGRSLSNLPILSLFQNEQDVFSEEWTSSVKHDCPLSEVLLPIAIMDLIGN